MSKQLQRCIWCNEIEYDFAVHVCNEKKQLHFRDLGNCANCSKELNNCNWVYWKTTEDKNLRLCWECAE